MKNSFCLKFLSLCLLFQKILGVEADNDFIIISRASTEIIHLNLPLIISDAEQSELEKLTHDLKYNRLDQHQVDRIFSNLASSNKQYAMNFLLTPRQGQLAPSQCRISKILNEAVIANNHQLIKFLLNRAPEQIQPDQWVINEVLWNAVIYNRETIVKSLLNSSEGQLHADKNGIGHAYQKALKIGHRHIINLFEPDW